MTWADCSQTVNGQQVATLKCIPVLFQSTITGILALVGTIAAVVIIFAGIRFTLARGDAKKIESAQHTIRLAIIGVIMVLLSFLIVTTIARITGVTCITTFGFTNC